MFHFPQVDKNSFRPDYDRVEWRDSPADTQAWKDGLTGYPIVDAAMRQLKTIGWMPNRARMIIASFLTKALLIDWREGERYFMQWLIDGDPAANNGGWQWTAGTGTDAQPYFRIFNPVTQSKKFDPRGVYIRHWIPELAQVPIAHIHAPWKMKQPPANYPPPIVDHQFARKRTLAAYKAIKRNLPNMMEK
jgi:deoxyribodipyrimidine photo-lyase